MSNELTPDNNAQTIWQNQKAEGMQMSIEDIRRKAGKFHKRILRRNAREYAGALVMVVYFPFVCWHTTDALTRAGFALITAGILYMVWHLYQKGSSRSAPAEMGMASGVQFYQQELERQRDLVASVWRWYLGPMMPGWVVLMVAFARTNPGHLRHYGLVLSMYNVVAVLFFVFVWKLNQRAAAKLQRQIDELGALGGSL